MMKFEVFKVPSSMWVDAVEWAQVGDRVYVSMTADRLGANCIEHQIVTGCVNTEVSESPLIGVDGVNVLYGCLPTKRKADYTFAYGVWMVKKFSPELRRMFIERLTFLDAFSFI